MKTYREKKQEEKMKLTKKIWNALNIEKAVKKFGFNEVKTALNHWTNYQRQNAKLIREKRALEAKLAEVESKL